MIDLIFILIPITVAAIAASHTTYHQRWLERYRYIENDLNHLRVELFQLEQRILEEEVDPKGIPHEEPSPDEWEMDSILSFPSQSHS